MIYLKSDSEIEKMRASAQLVSHTLAEVSKYIEPGIETGKLDVIAEDFIIIAQIEIIRYTNTEQRNYFY